MKHVIKTTMVIAVVLCNWSTTSAFGRSLGIDQLVRSDSWKTGHKASVILVADEQDGVGAWNRNRAISQNLPNKNRSSVPHNPYRSLDIDRYMADDEFPPYTRRPYTEKDEPDVFSEDDILYYDHQAYIQDRFHYANQRYKKAAKRYQKAKQQFLEEQRRYFHERDRFQAEQDDFASVSTGYAKTIGGTLTKQSGTMYLLEDPQGQTRRFHVGRDTLFDESVGQGDEVIAKVLPNGHAIAVVKDRGGKGIATQSGTDHDQSQN